MRIWKALLSAAGVTLALAPPALVVTGAPAVASNPNHVVVGAIRWDGQIGDSAVGDLAGVGPEEETALGPAKWHSRIPFYATVTGTNSISMNGAAQATVDQEIQMAHDAGIDYWAFDWYGDETGMQTARELYLQSAYHDEINWAAILWTHPLSEADLNTLVTQFQASNYQKVDGGRPLVYLYDISDYVSAAQVSELRSKTVAAMGQQPYVVALGFSATDAANFAGSVGADGVSNYASTGSDHEAYSSLASGEQADWNSWKNTGYGVVPWVTTGWDPQPRVQSTPAYTYASYSSTSGVTAPTPGELASQLQSAVNWDGSKASSAPAQAVLMYAWNEISEGGRIEPSISSRDNLDAVKSVLVGGSADDGSAGAPVITSDSPSTLRNDYSDFVGVKFTTGSTALTVDELGRKYVSGNSQVHVVKLVRASDNVDIGSVLLDMGAGVADAAGYKYTPLATPVALAANTTYYLMSSELSGGDQWYDVASGVTSNVVSVDSGVFRQTDADNNPVYTPWGTSGHSYGPVNLRYDDAPDLLLGKSVTVSSQWDSSQSGAKAVDGNLGTDWQGGSGLSYGQQWLQVDLGTAATFNTVTINEYRDDRTSGFVVEYQDGGGQWQPAYTGTTIGTGLTRTFPSVTASVVRLRFTSGIYTPIIFEFQVRSE